MGTRTYSRRAADGSRRLTALGRRRMTEEGTVPSDEFSPYANEFVPVLGDSYAVAANNIYKQNVELIYQSTPQAIDTYLSSIDGAPDEKELTKKHALALAAIGMDGTPEQRMRVCRLLDKHLETYDPALATLRLGSMDYLFYQAVKAPNPYQLDRGENVFLKRFWTRWANYGAIDTSRAGWAQLHSYMAEIGPNKGLPYPHDFYDEWRRPVEVNPEIVAVLQRAYEQTQTLLKEEGYPEEGMTLYRGTLQPRGLSMESFSSRLDIAVEFADFGGASTPWGSGKGQVRTEDVPRRFIMGSYKTIPDWPEDEVAGKQEYMVLGTAFYADKGVTRKEPASSGSGTRTLDSTLY